MTYTWGSEVIIDSTDLYLWYDGTEGEYTSGGILVPKSVEFDGARLHGRGVPPPAEIGKVEGVSHQAISVATGTATP